MNKKLQIGLIVLVVAIIAYEGMSWWQKQARLNGDLKVSGNIEGDEVKVSFRQPGQIVQLLTDEGKSVKTGDLIAKLNTDELSKIKDNAQAAFKAMQYQFILDQSNYKRAVNLYKNGGIPAQELDAAKTKFDADHANLKALKASLELAATRLGFAELISPLNGFVITKSALPGEFVQAGAPVFTIINLNHLWVTAYVNETDLGRVKLGQQAYIKTDTYPDKKYKGRVSFISSESEFTPKFIQTTEERVKLVYRIKIDVDNSSQDLKPGMPVDAYVKTHANDQD